MSAALRVLKYLAPAYAGIVYLQLLSGGALLIDRQFLDHVILGHMLVPLVPIPLLVVALKASPLSRELRNFRIGAMVVLALSWAQNILGTSGPKENFSVLIAHGANAGILFGGAVALAVLALKLPSAGRLSL
jgi:hypothetical protein